MTIAITINIPNPIPALKIPPANSQLVNVKSKTVKSDMRVIIFFMMLIFQLNLDKIKVQQQCLKRLTQFCKTIA